MRAVIFANGNLDQSFTPKPDDLLIAADGGAQHCLAQALQPAVVIGDLDSLEPDQLELLENGGAKIITYPQRKNFTDLELALDYAISQGVDEIIILGALGGRWDQTIANILLPIAFSSTQIKLINKEQEIYFIHGGDQLIISGAPNDTVSLIPLTQEAEGIRTDGLEYPLCDETLYMGSTRGVSNVMLSNQATIQLKKGILICAVIHF